MKKYLKMVAISFSIVLSYIVLEYCITLYFSGTSYYPYVIDETEIAFLLFIFYIFIAIQVILDKIGSMKK